MELAFCHVRRSSGSVHGVGVLDGDIIPLLLIKGEWCVFRKDQVFHRQNSEIRCSEVTRGSIMRSQSRLKRLPICQKRRRWHARPQSERAPTRQRRPPQGTSWSNPTETCHLAKLVRRIFKIRILELKTEQRNRWRQPRRGCESNIST